jgi:glycogen debranching enzyme
MTQKSLKQLALDSLLNLSTDEGINASGKDEIYGCIFGRDSALTILKILRSHFQQPSLELLEVSRRALLTLVSLQGQEFNLESGEEPGKFIHEFRKEERLYKHLVQRPKPWYLYPDKTLKNYDSVDSTPLTLIAIYTYWQITQDSEFLMQSLDAVEKGLNWIITFGDKDKDYLLEYELPEDRIHGGLPVQSWTDSHESLLQPDGQMPKYPIAPVEAQGYAWLALKIWAHFYQDKSPEFARKLEAFAREMKSQFNTHFLIKDQDLTYAAQALDGNKRKIKTITGNPLLLLWASFYDGENIESILEDKYISDLVKRAFKKDLFDKDGGIRTMSTLSPTFINSQNSYHNGSFWPILNGMAHEGLLNWGFNRQARQLKKASLKALSHFQTPIELYVKTEDGKLLEYSNPRGQTSCKVQAWSAAALLDFTVYQDSFYLKFLDETVDFLNRPFRFLWEQSSF